MSSSIPHLTEPTTAYDLLTKVCAVITEEPKRYYQGDWIISRDHTDNPIKLHRVEMPACGTVCCVAGWIETMRVGPAHTVDLAESSMRRHIKAHVVAARTLGITSEEAVPLFNAEAIQDLSDRLGVPQPPIGSTEYAALGVKHIKAFQRKHAAKLRAKVVRPKRSDLGAVTLTEKGA